MNKYIYFDCETTGLSPAKQDIIQIAGMIDYDDITKDHFNFKLQPFDYDTIDKKALEISNTKIYDLKTYEEPVAVYKKLINLFDKHIDKFNKADKFIVCGYNVRFDIDFLNHFFKKNGNNFLFSYFGHDKDPFQLLKYLNSSEKLSLTTLKLENVCKHFGVNIENAHTAFDDIMATKELIKLLDRKILIGI